MHSKLPAFTGKLTGESPPPSESLCVYRQPMTAWTDALPPFVRASAVITADKAFSPSAQSDGRPKPSSSAS